MRWVYRSLAGLFLILAFFGIFVPLLPTVPFLLLAIFLLFRSSKRDVVKIKRLPIVGRRLYPHVKRWAKWNTRSQSSSI
ncbi:DUF454 family protein [Thermocrinis sp.]